MRFVDVNHELFFGGPVKALSLRPLRLPFDFLRYHVWTCFLFVVDDIKTIIVPCVSSLSLFDMIVSTNYFNRPCSRWSPRPFHAPLRALPSSWAGFSFTCCFATSLTRVHHPSKTRRTNRTDPSLQADYPTKRLNVSWWCFMAYASSCPTS